MSSLTQYIDIYQANKALIEGKCPEPLNAPRAAALQRLLSAGRLPRKGDEGYPALSVEEMFAPDFGINLARMPFEVNTGETFKCGVPNISTLTAMIVNDTFRPSEGLMRNLPAGVKVMSLSQAAAEMPELVAKHYNALAAEHGNAVTDLNTLLAQDGIFVHVGAGVAMDRPLQIVNIFNAAAPLLAMRRILVVLEADAQASILLCDHSATPDVAYLASQVVEISLAPGARLEVADMEESSAATGRVAQTFAIMDERSELKINSITLLGGRTRNSIHVDINGPHADCRLGGMATASAQQLVDNFTRVRHHAPECHSDQMYKYILDDRAQGTFYGTIVVDEPAKFTRAYQSNRNILACADARMHTRPQLEIYCDEVKCSHGATVGQLDQNALFYMQSRGIPLAQARMMLMQAFAADVIDSVSIPALQSRLHQLVERRLVGEHELCAGCSLSDQNLVNH